MRTHKKTLLTGVAVATAVMLGVPALAANAYAPTGDVVYQVPADQDCLKGRGNCAIYPKSTELPNGDLLMAFERSTVVAETGSADGQTLPVYRSTDDGETWAPLSEVAAPAYLSDDPAYAPYVSNWTNPYLYVLPDAIGGLAAGTVLLASVVSGDDEYYKERIAADPSWVPSNDGDRSDLAIALFASSDEGETWTVVDIVAEGGWQGGSAGNAGTAIASANVHRQVDPLWEPFVYLHDGELVVHYSDENDYIGWDPVTGVPTVDPDNDTAADSHGQILVHKTWDGDTWSAPVVDVAGLTQDRGNGKTQIGGGRPGMTTVVPTTDGRSMMTFEYFGGGQDVRYKIADDPRTFGLDGDPDGTEVRWLPTTSGSDDVTAGGSPVLAALPDGRIAYNANGSSDIWVNESGRSDGAWTQFQAPIGAGYSRTLQPVRQTGRVVILQSSWGGAGAQAVINRAEVDLGHSAGDYVSLVNRKTGQVLGTGGNITDANIGNADQPDVRGENPRTDERADTQLWHIITEDDGTVTLLNKSGGREAAIWTGNAVAGQRIGQWVDNVAGGLYRMVETDDGGVTFASAQNPALYLSTLGTDSSATLEPASTDGAHEWLIEAAPEPEPEPTPALTVSATSVPVGGTVTIDGSGFVGDSVALTLHSDPIALATVVPDADGSFRVTVSIPAAAMPGAHTLRATVAPSGATVEVPLALTAAAGAPGEEATGSPAAPGGNGASGGAGSGRLAATGAPVPAWTAVAGLAMLLAGAAAVVIRRRTAGRR